MLTSQLTSKGQTTIPAAVRQALGLGPQDRLVYEIREDQVIVRALRGNLLQQKGTVVGPSGSQDDKSVRGLVRRKVAERAAKR